MPPEKPKKEVVQSPKREAWGTEYTPKKPFVPTEPPKPPSKTQKGQK